jgi:hypothetical protein
MRAIAMQRTRIARSSKQDDSFFANTTFRQEIDVHFLLLAPRWTVAVNRDRDVSGIIG